MPKGGARKGAGRPVGSTKSDTSTEWLQVRVTAHEKETIRRRAAVQGVSVSEYVKLHTLSGRDDT